MVGRRTIIVIGWPYAKLFDFGLRSDLIEVLKCRISSLALRLLARSVDCRAGRDFGPPAGSESMQFDDLLRGGTRERVRIGLCICAHCHPRRKHRLTASRGG